MSARRQNDGWFYPPIEDARNTAGLLPIEVYITRRRNHLPAQITPRPIYRICQATPGCLRPPQPHRSGGNSLL